MTALPPALPDDLPYAQLFGNLSAQLQSLNQKVQLLERAARGATARASEVTPDMITGLQGFDYLRQSLNDLARLTQLLAKQTENSDLAGVPVAQIAMQLEMADTRALLEVRPDAAGQDPAQVSGKPHFF